MNKTKQLLDQYFEKNIDANDLEKVVSNSIFTINSMVVKRAKIKKQLILTSWYASSASVLASFLWLYVDLKNSGSLMMIKILMNGFSSVVENWQDYLMSLTDLMPAYSLLVTVLSVAAFIVFNKLKSGVKNVKLNHFVI